MSLAESRCLTTSFSDQTDTAIGMKNIVFTRIFVISENESFHEEDDVSYDDVLHHFTQRIKEVLKCKSEQAKSLAKSMVNACKVAFPVITTDLLGIH